MEVAAAAPCRRLAMMLLLCLLCAEDDLDCPTTYLLLQDTGELWQPALLIPVLVMGVIRQQ